MEYFWLTGAIILLLVFIFDRSVLSIDVKALKLVVKVLAIGSVLSLVVNLISGRFPPLLPVPVTSLFFVGWEDAVFVLLPIYYAEKFLPKWGFVISAVVSSIVFGLGHLYQGWFIVLLLSFYPYFISYKYGKKYGFGTVIILHTIYDLVIFGNTTLLHHIKGLL